MWELQNGTDHKRQYNTAHAHCTLDTQGCRHTHNIQQLLITHASIVTRTRHVMLTDSPDRSDRCM